MGSTVRSDAYCGRKDAEQTPVAGVNSRVCHVEIFHRRQLHVQESVINALEQEISGFSASALRGLAPGKHETA